MTTSRLAAALLAGGLLAAPALADEYTTYENLEIASPSAPECRIGALASLPAGWRSHDGAVVLLTVGPQRDAMRDVLVSALLAEQAAVLELAARPCAARDGAEESLADLARGALDAMRRSIGGGMVVAIGYGPGGAAVLDVVRGPTATLPGARYAAAVALGGEAPAFALGAALPAEEHAPARLAMLCHALAAASGGMGATPARAAPAAASAACIAAMARGTPIAAAPIPAAARR